MTVKSIMMMKKAYNKPEIAIVEIRIQRILTASVPKNDEWTPDQW